MTALGTPTVKHVEHGEGGIVSVWGPNRADAPCRLTREKGVSEPVGQAEDQGAEAASSSLSSRSMLPSSIPSLSAYAPRNWPWDSANRAHPNERRVKAGDCAQGGVRAARWPRRANPKEEVDGMGMLLLELEEGAVAVKSSMRFSRKDGWMDGRLFRCGLGKSPVENKCQTRTGTSMNLAKLPVSHPNARVARKSWCSNPSLLKYREMCMQKQRSLYPRLVLHL
jgi:hypothetical protein